MNQTFCSGAGWLKILEQQQLISNYNFVFFFKSNFCCYFIANLFEKIKSAQKKLVYIFYQIKYFILLTEMYKKKTHTRFAKIKTDFLIRF